MQPVVIILLSWLLVGACTAVGGLMWVCRKSAEALDSSRAQGVSQVEGD